MLYILLLLAITFSKELIAINAEFVVIIGFLTIFFILKSLLMGPIVENLDLYSQKIRTDYLARINTEFFAVDSLINSLEEKVQYRLDLENYYILLEDLIIDFIEASKKNLIFHSSATIMNIFIKKFLRIETLFKAVHKINTKGLLKRVLKKKKKFK